MEELMTTQEVADYLRIKKQTLEAWRSKNINNIPYIKIATSVRYRRRDLEEWVQKQLNKGSL